MKYCEDCRWFKHSYFVWLHVCTHEKSGNGFGFVPVYRPMRPAKDMREDSYYVGCGIEGKLWEGKE